MNNTVRIDLLKLLKFVLKHCWLVILCAAIGAGMMYYRTEQRPDMYTASGTMYVVNANPNMVNYGYTNTTDLSSAVQLIDTYSVVVKSERVMSTVLDTELDVLDEFGKATGEKFLLSQKYPELNTGLISATISMGSVNQTGMVRVSCTTNQPEKSRDICNAVLMNAPKAIVDVVGAGKAELVDAATLPLFPNSRGSMRQGIMGAIIGGGLAAALLLLICLLNQKVSSAKDLTASYTPPVLSSIRRSRRGSKDPDAYLLSKASEMELIESYAKLRINLMYTLSGKKNHVVEVTSAVSGEGKSTIAANLAISCAMSGKRVLLIDADMRRACQQDVFHYEADLPGLSNVLAGNCGWADTVVPGGQELLSVMPAGQIPPNPSELLESDAMRQLLKEVDQAYDLVLLDVPPINIVADPLTLSADVAGSVFVVRQGFSTHKEIRKALISAEMTGMDILGFVYYGENQLQDTISGYKNYKNYYQKYDTRRRAGTKAQGTSGAQSQGERHPRVRRHESAGDERGTVTGGE